MITLKQLRYLTALAEHRHFGRAADACAISQPALSMQIRGLEKDLGVVLVERRHGDVTLTETGLELARRGENLLAGAHDLVDFARLRTQPLSGGLALGIIPTLAPYVLPKVLPALQRQYPDLRVELRETQTKILVDELMRGSLDVLMLALPILEIETATTALFDDPFLLAVPKSDPRPARTVVSADDIDLTRLVLLEEGHCLRDQALAFCAGDRRDKSLGLGATSLATVLQMVANGYGITLLPEVAVDVEARNELVKLLRFAPPMPKRTVGLAWRPSSPRKSDFVALGEIVVEALGKHEATARPGTSARPARAANRPPRRRNRT
jgi:LysR family transcriptional regulator, hydrogen peroxide-inducible genes activator